MHDEEVFIAIAAMITAVVVIKIIARSITQIVCHWSDSSLKMRLVEAGMSATEIEQVVGAHRRRRVKVKSKQTGKPALDEYSYNQ